MPAGTVISGGFPGRVAQEVQPNQKCGGCMHYDGQVGRTGSCTIGDSPWKCGDGDMPDIGYAPIVQGAGGHLPEMSSHGSHASGVEPQHVGGLYGSGSTRPVEVRQVALGEEHVHLVKGMVERHAELQKSQCLRCSMRGAHGTSPHNVDPQPCTCRPIEAATIAKAVVDRMSNAEKARAPVTAVADWVRRVAKAGFRLPERDRAEASRQAPPSTSDQLLVDGAGGHLRPIAKGAFSRLGEAAVHLTGVAHSDGTGQAHKRALDAHKKAAAEGGPKASFHEQHVTYHQAQVKLLQGEAKKSLYSEDWITQFKGTSLFDEARRLCEQELKLEEGDLARRQKNNEREKARRTEAKPDYDWQESEDRRSKIRIAKQRLALRLAGLHQQKMTDAKAR